MVRPARALYFISLLSLPVSAVSAQTKSTQPGVSKDEETRQGVCSEAPTGDASPSTCIPANVRNGANALQEAENLPQATVSVAKVDLVVPEGAALRIALDQRTRVSHPGEPVHGTVVETVYAFDQPVIPAGSVATGRVTKVNAVSAIRRARAYSNGDLTPVHAYEITFDTVILPDGRRLPVATTVSPGTAQVVHLMTSAAQKQKNATGRAADSAKQEAKGAIQNAEDQLHKGWEEVSAPGRMHRLKQYLLAQSPYRRQYIEPGTHFNADLDQTLSFGQIDRTSTELSALASALTPNTTLKARLTAQVSSATASRGTRVEAALTEPLYSPAHQIILPADSRIIGQVVQSKAAHKFHRNGELRLIFERIEIPAEAQRAAEDASQKLSAQNSAEQARPELSRRSNLRMSGNLEGVEVDKRDHMVLDEEGGAHTTESKTRYLSTGVAVLLAAAASRTDVDHGTVDSAGDPSVRTAAGGSGFRITGALISFASKSQPVSIAFGVYGASASIYSNFLSRGREVVFPKDTPLEIGFGSPHGNTPVTP